MGIDALDTLFRLEKSFGQKFEPNLWERVPKGHAEPASFWEFGRFVWKSSNPNWKYERVVPVVTAGDVHDAVCASLTERGVPVPPDSWDRVRTVLSEVTGHAVETITAQSRLFQDLGFG